MVPEEGEMPLNKAREAVKKAKMATAKQFDVFDFLDHCIDFLNNPNLYDAKQIIKSVRRLKKNV